MSDMLINDRDEIEQFARRIHDGNLPSGFYKYGEADGSIENYAREVLEDEDSAHIFYIDMLLAIFDVVGAAGFAFDSATPRSRFSVACQSRMDGEITEDEYRQLKEKGVVPFSRNWFVLERFETSPDRIRPIAELC